jgi:hypothetical protein
VLPLSVLTCHFNVGVGVPLAVAVKLALLPAVTVWFEGCPPVNDGVVAAAVTVSVKVWVASGLVPLLAVKVTVNGVPFVSGGVPLRTPVVALKLA